MEENWEQYATDKDDWEQYSTKDKPKGSALSDAFSSLIGGGIGIGVAGGIGYGLLKTGIPQKIGRGINLTSQGISNLPKVTNINKGDAFAKEIRGEFVKAHSNKVATFGNQIDQLSAKYPKQSVSLQTVVDDLNTNWNELPNEVKTVVKKTPYLRNMVNSKNPATTELSLSKSQEVINYINTKIPPKIRFNNLDVVETVNNIRGAQLDAFPEMEAVRSDYKSFIEPYNQVKGQFRFNKLLNAIKNKFGGAEGQVAVEKILPKEVIKKMGGYRAAAKIAQMPKALPLVGRMLGISMPMLQVGTFASKMKEIEKSAKKAISGRAYYKFDISGIPEEVKLKNMII